MQYDLKCIGTIGGEVVRHIRVLNDKPELAGDDRSGLYLFDRDIMNYRGKA